MKYEAYLSMSFNALRKMYVRKGWTFRAESCDEVRVTNGIYEFLPVFFDNFGSDTNESGFCPLLAVEMVKACARSYAREFSYENRKARNEVVSLEGFGDSLPSMGTELARVELLALIDSLPEKQAAVIRGLYEGYTLTEIANNNGFSVKTASKWRDKAFKTIREMREYYGF